MIHKLTSYPIAKFHQRTAIQSTYWNMHIVIKVNCYYGIISAKKE